MVQNELCVWVLSKDMSGGLRSVVIFSSSIVVQSKLGIFIIWCSQEFTLGLRVVIKANNILGSGYCLF